MRYLRHILLGVLIILLSFNLVACNDNSDESEQMPETEEVISESEAIEEVNEQVGFMIVAEDELPSWQFDMTRDFTWEIEEPFINPLGEYGEYQEVIYEERGYFSLEFLDEGMNPVGFDLIGDVYFLTVPFNSDFEFDQNINFAKDFGEYIESIGGNDYGLYKGNHVINIKDDNGDLWWGKITTSANDILLEIFREDVLRLGETLVVPMSADQSEVYFSIDHSDENFISLSLDFTGEIFEGDLSIMMHEQDGDYKREYRQGYSFSDYVGNSYTLTDFPSERGLIRCAFSWYPDNSEGTVDIVLDKILSRQSNPYGDNMGAIKVSAEYVSSCEAIQANEYAYLSHPDFDSEKRFLDTTPDGDFLLMVPAGLWNLKIYPENSEKISDYRILGVPVYSGQVTLVDVPFSIASSNSNKSSAIDARGIDMHSFLEKDNQVKYRFTLLDQSTKSIEPDLENTVVYESGQPVDVIALDRLNSPAEVYLLLDSSGSMKGKMTEVLDAAKVFIGNMQEDTIIKLVDFDSTVKPFDGSTIEEALSNLDKISVGGDTALYQSIIMAMDKLKTSSRPIIVSFTDGENELKNETIEELDLIEEIKEHNIPIYTIGFGDNHDDRMLLEISNASFGKYFDAKNPEALKEVFAAINERLSNSFELTYNRPESAGLGDTPILTFLIDTSGSMEYVDEGYGERMHNLKELMKPFLLDLPDKYRTQVMGFADSPYYVQSLTADKGKLIMAVDALESGGGTDIASALDGATIGLKNLASTKKVLVLVTDEAMDSSDEFFLEQVKLLNTLGIKTLWVGIGGLDVHEDFQKAADLSGGQYLLTNDSEEMKAKIEELMAEVESIPDSGFSEVSMVIDKEDEFGNIESFGETQLVKLGPLRISEKVETVNSIKEVVIGPLAQYDDYTATLLSGVSIPKIETIITGRMDVNKERLNEAISISVSDVFFMDSLNGVEAPSNHQFVALSLDIKNVLKEQKVIVYPDGSNHPSAFVSNPDQGEEVSMIPDYLIPDFKNHFFLDINHKGGINASVATYLANTPIITPGQPELLLKANDLKEGVLVFIAPKESIDSMTLSFYDLNYGHIHLPVVGTLDTHGLSYGKKAIGSPVDISEKFSLDIVDVEDLPLVDEYGQIVEDLVLRQVAGVFQTNLQALLTMDPVERIKLEIQTGQGNIYFDIHPKTAAIPYGHFGQKMMAPGGDNLSIWQFEIPKDLVSYPANLRIDLDVDDIVIPLETGFEQMVSKEPLFVGEVDVSGDGLNDLKVSILNAVKLEESVGSIGSKMTVLEMVIDDYKDGFSTVGLEEMFLVTSNLENDYVRPESYKISLMDLHDQVVLDGTSRKGVLIFNSSLDDLVVTSPYFDDLNLEVAKGSIEPVIGVGPSYFEIDDSFDSVLYSAISEVIEGYQSTIDYEERAIVDIEEDENEVPVRSIASYGASIMDGVINLEDMLELLKSLRYVPSDKALEPFTNIYAPEAMISQGYGTEQDYGVLAIKLLSQMGYQPKLKTVDLTEKGKEALSDFARKQTNINRLPAVQFEEMGESRLLVLPFVEDIKDLQGLVYYGHDQEVRLDKDTMTLAINVLAENLMPDRADLMMEFTDALAGDDDRGEHLDSIELYYGDFDLPSISLEALDIGFYDAGGSYMMNILIGKEIIPGQIRLNKKLHNPKAIELRFYASNQVFKKIIWLDEERTLDQYYLTLGLNLPDMTDEAIDYLETSGKSTRMKVTTYNDLSAIRWYTRDILYGLIANQSQEDRRLAELMDVSIGRTNKERIVLLTLVAQSGDKPLETYIDLIQNSTDIHSGDELDRRGFNIMSGLFQTQLESYILGNEGIGTFEILANTPDTAGMVILEPFLYNADEDAMMEAGLPIHLIEYFSDNDKYSIISDKPAVINGQSRWAWIEVDPDDYSVIGVTDNLSHGAMVQNAITGTVKDIGQYFVGQFVGTTTAMWSVAGFSLIEDDYDVILENAKKFALGMKDSFGLKEGKFSVSVGGKPQISQKFMGFKVSFNGKVGFGQTTYSFTSGFQDGINAYFDKAK